MSLYALKSRHLSDIPVISHAIENENINYIFFTCELLVLVFHRPCELFKISHKLKQNIHWFSRRLRTNYENSDDFYYFT